MINKKNLWFLTLFTLILVLSVYYITMPSELLLTDNVSKVNENVKEVVEEKSEIIEALKVSKEEEYLSELDELKIILNDDKSTLDDKNSAFDKMKTLNSNKLKEEELEKMIEETYNLKSFIQIKESKIKVVISSKEHDKALANNIMNTLQDNFQSKMYITVQFS